MTHSEGDSLLMEQKIDENVAKLINISKDFFFCYFESSHRKDNKKGNEESYLETFW